MAVITLRRKQPNYLSIREWMIQKHNRANRDEYQKTLIWTQCQTQKECILYGYAIEFQGQNILKLIYGDRN